MFWFWFKKNWNPRSGCSSEYQMQFQFWVTQSETHGQPSVPDLYPPEFFYFYLFIYFQFRFQNQLVQVWFLNWIWIDLSSSSNKIRTSSDFVLTRTKTP
jgi:hypothetical protein